MRRRGAGRDPQRLLRWYPRAWRREHGAVLLGLLAEQAADRGRGLSAGEAWSMRLHGIAEWFTPRAGAVLAVGGLLAGLLAVASPFAVDRAPEDVVVVAAAVTGALASALTSLSVLTLVRDAGWTTAVGTVVSATALLGAWTVSVPAGLAWSVGFDQADAGLPRTPFASAWPVLLAVAVALGAVALAPAIAGGLRRIPTTAGRWALAVACGVPAAVLIAVTTVAPGGSLLVAVVLLVLCIARQQPGTSATREDHQVATARVDPPPSPRTGDAHRPPPAVLPLAVVGFLLTTPCALYAVLGGGDTSWTGFPAALEALPPMNTGLALGALASLPLVPAAALLVSRRVRRGVGLAATLVCVAVQGQAVSAGMGPDGDGGFLVVVAAGALAGVAVVSLLAPRLPGPASTRRLLVAVIGVATGWVVGVPVLMVGPLIAPFIALGLAVHVLRPLTRRPRRTGQPQLAVG
ncbi:hypothetical protein WDZ17_16910 [Pseudokineococcus basanitobsidens]|uniref:Integral membrane protein n=1 Tax=Pseudokineococcus basanitobsidens TaxID=1926649 RepID=A0ABU8RPD9_9ACTN